MPVPSSKKVIAIIGGGFSGTMTAIHLLTQDKTPVHVILVNHRYPLNKGIAFSSYSHKHLLNVAAGNMSAFPDKPLHFVNWIKNHEKYSALDQNELPKMFLPRNIYGYYLKDTFENAIRNKHAHNSIEFIHDEAIDAQTKDNGVEILFSVSPPVIADKVVLATGNQDPRPPSFSHEQFISRKQFFPNPWINESVTHAEQLNNVLIIGNGLTMVDVVLGLYEHNFKGKIWSLSPHGFKILPHRKFDPYHDIIAELEVPYNLGQLVRIVRAHIRKLRKSGITGEAVIDALRPHTQKIWMSLSLQEKERFLFHLRHMWGVARHRLPRELHKFIQQLILDDKLEIVAGKIVSISDSGSQLKIGIQRKHKNEILELNADRVINCTGPEADIRRYQNELIQNLLERKLIFADDLRLGINATADGEILDSDGKKSSRFYTLGTSLKGILWESTAVPEIRKQAFVLSQMLLH